MKKRIALILSLALGLGLAFTPASLAESHAGDFFAGLSQAWDGLRGMAEDAGRAVSDWTVDSGVADWFDGAGQSIAAWADESGLTAWTQGALDDISAWARDSGLTDWTQEIAANVQILVDEYGPELQRWLASAGEEVEKAWNTLTNADQHTQAEVQDALQTVTEALEDANADG